MSMDLLVAEVLACGPVEPASTARDRSPESLAMLLAKAAERVRTDPAENLSHCAVRWTAEILRDRLDERMPGLSAGATDGPSAGIGREPGVDDAD